MENKEIFIVHEYYTKSHFKALYDYADKYGYCIKGYIILKKRVILKKLLKDIIKEKKVIAPIKEFYNNCYNLINLKFMKNKILIVGIAPYDKLLNKYYKCFMRNKSIYFTSWQFWDGSKFAKGSLKNKEKYEELMVKSFKGVACVSKKTEESMKSYFKNRVIVNHAIDVDGYKNKVIEINNSSNAKKYIYLGQLIERKNIDLMIDWINKNNDKQFKFDFAGDGKLRNKVIELCNSDKRVNYLGKLTNKQIMDKLQGYDFLVLPSKEEPYGIVLLEALAAGVPCIVSNALGPAEIISDSYDGFIFDKSKNESFDIVMQKSLNIKLDEYIQLSKNAFNESKKFDSKNLIKEWINIIER